MVQEALTNVAKHAGASRVRVAIGQADGALWLEIEDDGSGFDADAKTSGFGLAGMRERVALAGGTLEISSPGKGTLVKASLPVRTAGASNVERSRAKQAAS